MKIDISSLRNSRKESTDKRNQLIADLRQQVADSISSYLDNLAVPAGAECLKIFLNAFYIKEGTLYVDFDKEFTSSDVSDLSVYGLHDIIPICSVQGAVLSVPQSRFEKISSFVKSETIVVNYTSDYALYYRETVGSISFPEIWEEEIPENFRISLI